jgi:hypothetical protein
MINPKVLFIACLAASLAGCALFQPQPEAPPPPPPVARVVPAPVVKPAVVAPKPAVHKGKAVKKLAPGQRPSNYGHL